MDIHLKAFWKNGNGSQLIKWSNAEIDFSTSDTNKHLKDQYDTLGDAAAKEIFKERNFPEGYAYIQQLSKTKISAEDALPENIKKLFLNLQEVPSWVDQDLMNAGCALSMRSGINALIALRDYSLMGGYDYAYLNKPLIYTGALKKGAAKRMTDTLDFWVQVTRKDALKTNHEGYKYIVRTRMIHSFSRIMIKEKYQNWNTQTWGEPINYGDMVATSIGFSLLYMHGIHKLGIDISEKEELGVFHLWKYIGHLLGIPENQLPTTKKEATEMFYLWTTTQASADEDSIILAKALENESIASNVFKKSYQKKFLKYLHTCYVRFLIDEQTCDRLGITQIWMPFVLPKFRRFRNVISEKLVGLSNKNYQRSVALGDIVQQKISGEYLKADSQHHINK